MNNNTYIICKDIDQLILTYLSPPQVLCMSEVNRSLLAIAQPMRDRINQVKRCLDTACSHGYLDIAEYIWKRRNFWYNFDSAFISACKANQFEAAKWVVNTEKKAGDRYRGPCRSYDGISSYSNAFVYVCRNNNLDMAKWLIKLPEKNGFRKIDIHSGEPSIFYFICKKGNRKFIKWLFYLSEIGYGKYDKNSCYNMFEYSCLTGNIKLAKLIMDLYEKSSGKTFDIHCISESIFAEVCEKGHLNTCQWLISLCEQSYDQINIHAGGEEAFIAACINNHIDIAKWLISLGEQSYGQINIHAKNEEAFIAACIHDLQFAQWLVELGEQSYGEIDIHAQNGSAFVNVLKDETTTNWFIGLSKKYRSRIIINERIRGCDAYQKLSEKDRLELVQKLNE